MMFNLVHPVISGMLTTFTGLPRKMISNFVGLFGFFRGKEDKAGDHSYKRTDPEPEILEKIPQSNDSDAEKPKRVFCLICRENGDHETIDCPDKAEAYVTLCRICDDGPCENEDYPDHKEEHYEYLMRCNYCSIIGQHWEDTCPFNNSDDDMDFN